MDIVIPYIDDKNNGFELRYALRSIQQYLKSYSNIIIVSTNPPQWLKNVILVKDNTVKDNQTKTKNILKKILTAFDYSSQDIFFTNDDIFFLKDIDVRHYPFYYSTSAQQLIADRPNIDIYKQIMINTNIALNQAGIEDFKYFDIHCPILYNKKLFLNMYENFKTNIHSNKYGLLIKSLYGNSYEIEGIDIDDFIIRQKIETFKDLEDSNLYKNDYFSIEHNKIHELGNFLPLLYPNKSKYEKD